MSALLCRCGVLYQNSDGNRCAAAFAEDVVFLLATLFTDSPRIAAQIGNVDDLGGNHINYETLAARS